MRYQAATQFAFSSFLFLFFSGCGASRDGDSTRADDPRRAGQRDASTSEADINAAEKSRPADSGQFDRGASEDGLSQILAMVEIPLDETGLQLSQATSSTVLAQDETIIEGEVPTRLSLQVDSALTFPEDAENRPYDLGCVTVRLEDNANFGNATWLTIATAGVRGQTITDVIVPLTMDANGWQQVPNVGHAFELDRFPEATVRNHQRTVCFRIDLSQAPAQRYAGSIVIQYRAPGQPFACASNSLTAAADQTLDVRWTGAGAGELTYQRGAEGGLTIDGSYFSSPIDWDLILGTIEEVEPGFVRYTAPSLDSIAHTGLSTVVLFATTTQDGTQAKCSIQIDQ